MPLINKKLPTIYPQITQAPTDYAGFLNFFRGGHTIDDNLTATSIASTMQAGMLKAAKAGILRRRRTWRYLTSSL